MNLTDLLMMRQELLMILLTLLVVIIDLFTEKKSGVIQTAVLLFTLITIAGFLPVEQGTIFGGMYQSNALVAGMKNILNIAMLIVMLQSVKWLLKDENAGKSSEFLVLLFSTLIGMDYMISSGDFLMFYIGLELATIPATVLAAYDKKRNNSAESGIKFIFSSAFSSGILLLGLSLIYGATGSIYFNDVLAVFGKSAIHMLGFIFFLSGMGFKISLVPFHFWGG